MVVGAVAGVFAVVGVFAVAGVDVVSGESLLGERIFSDDLSLFVPEGGGGGGAGQESTDAFGAQAAMNGTRPMKTKSINC